VTKEFEQYHGIVLTCIVHSAPKPVTVEFYPSKSNSSYVLNGSTGLYIKHSTKRTSPWRYTFAKSHQDEIKEMYERLGEVFTALVCRDDGVAVLSFKELKSILDDNHGASEWVSVSRRRHKQYSVSGSDGDLDFKVSRKSCPAKILERLIG
jgi:hypothetical protein